MKKIAFIFLLFLSVLLISGCDTTFNDGETKALTNPDNYKKYDVTFSYLKTNDNSTNYTKSDVYLYVTFHTLDELNLFMSTPLEEGVDLEAYSIPFLIKQTNSKELSNNGFYDDIKEGDSLSIWVSNYRDHFGTYLWVAAIEANGKTYLSFEVGMNNIKTFIQENQSPWFK